MIVVSAISGRFKKSSTLIFLSYIFLSAKPKQENVGEENADLRISQISHYGRNDDHSRKFFAVIFFTRQTYRERGAV